MFRFIALCLIVFLGGGGARAEVPQKYIQCFNDAGLRYDVDPFLLMAVAKTESNFNQYAINDRNNNKTVDYGVMQINSIWLKELGVYNINKNTLINKSCVNINVGAWILSKSLKYYKGDVVNGIGGYNVGFKSNRGALRKAYAQKVIKNYHKFIANRDVSEPEWLSGASFSGKNSSVEQVIYKASIDD